MIHHWPEYHGRARPPSSAPDAARVRVPRRVPQRCGADRGPAVLRSAVSHRHNGELDYHSDAAPNPGRQARPALGFAPACVGAQRGDRRAGACAQRPSSRSVLIWEATSSHMLMSTPFEVARGAPPLYTPPVSPLCPSIPPPPRPSASRTFGVKAGFCPQICTTIWKRNIKPNSREPQISNILAGNASNSTSTGESRPTEKRCQFVTCHSSSATAELKT